MSFYFIYSGKSFFFFSLKAVVFIMLKSCIGKNKIKLVLGTWSTTILRGSLPYATQKANKFRKSIYIYIYNNQKMQMGTSEN